MFTDIYCEEELALTFPKLQFSLRNAITGILLTNEKSEIIKTTPDQWNWILIDKNLPYDLILHGKIYSWQELIDNHILYDNNVEDPIDLTIYFNEAKNAQIDLVRYKTLLEQDSIAAQQMVTQEALINQDKGIIEIDKGLVANAKLQLLYTRITSPITGRL